MLVFLGMGIVACGNLLAASATTVYGVIAGRAVAGFGYSPAVIGTLTLLAGFATQTSRARIFSLYEFFIVAGLAASTALAGFIGEWMGWRAGFVLGAALALGGLGATMVSLSRGTLIRMPPRSSDPPETPPRERSTARIVVWPAGFVLLTSFALSYAWTGHFYTLYPLYGGEQLGLGTEMVGVAMSVGYVVDLALLFPYGWLADRYGRVPVLFAGVLLVALAAFALPLSSSGLGYLAIGVLTGVGFACWGLPPALLSDWVPSGSRGMVLGLYRFMIDLGFILGPWTVSVVLEGEGFQIAAWMVAGLSGVGLLAFFGLRSHPSSAVRGVRAELNE
jgi:MFS family permease